MELEPLGSWAQRVQRQRGGGPYGGDPDEPVHNVQGAGGRPAGLPDGRVGPGQHPPQQPARGAAAEPLASAARGGHEPADRSELITRVFQVRRIPQGRG